MCCAVLPVETELMLCDMDSLEKRANVAQKKIKTGDAEAKHQLAAMEPALAALQAGKPARTALAALSAEVKPYFHQLQLLTGKPVLYVANVAEGEAATGNELSAKVAAKAKAEGTEAVIIAAAIEAEVAVMGSAVEQQEFLSTLGLNEPGLNRVIRAGYKLLDLITFFTVGPKEAHAWTVKRAATAPEAAGAIHTDFQRGFIRAETIAYDDFIAHGGEQGAAAAGKMRQEGKEYIVKDGDIFHFKFNV
jgi:ribosome-binding ATPase